MQSRDTAPYTVLCVDDEGAILRSMKRVLLKEKYHILLAQSGAEALDLLATYHVDVIVSDMRMPEMSGAEFLEQAAKRYPDTYRMVLSGYADLESTVDAVNKGKIHRFLHKPWEQDLFIEAVREGVNWVRLKTENALLQEKVARQNTLLKGLNENLEQKVELRTKQVNLARHKIERSHLATHKMLLNFIAVNPSLDGNAAKCVGTLAGRLAEKLGLEKGQAMAVKLAGFLNEIGLLGLDPALSTLPFSEMSYDQQKSYLSQAQIAQMILAPSAELEPVSDILSQQFLHLDDDEQDPPEIGAQILAIARDFWRYANGRILPVDLDLQKIRIEMNKGRGQKYASPILDVLFDHPEMIEMPALEKGIPTSAVEPGMVLLHSLFTESHMLILSEGHVFTESSIARLRQYERNKKHPLSVVVEAFVSEV